MRQVALLAALALAGCASTIHSGRAPGRPAPYYDGRWRHSLLFGTIPLDRDVDVRRECPAGWSEVHTAVTVPAALMMLVTGFMYTPTTLTLVCADPNADRWAPLPRADRP